MHWKPLPKPAQCTESRLIQAMLDGIFAIGTSLPPERELAAMLGVTRPTLREALQRLECNGWIEIRHGRPTRVRNYWEDGNLGVMIAMARYQDRLPEGFIPDLLYVRILLAPDYTRLAIENEPARIIDQLQQYTELSESAQAYARFDWQVHKQLALASGNSFFVYFINSVQRLYDLVGVPYFDHLETRAHSRNFYRQLLDCALRRDSASAYALSQRVMGESREFWLRLNSPPLPDEKIA